MTHKNIYFIYRDLLSIYAEKTVKMIPYGLNRIKLTIDDGREFVFEYNSPTNWSFGTLTKTHKKGK